MTTSQAARETVSVGRLTITTNGQAAGQLCFRAARAEFFCIGTR